MRKLVLAAVAVLAFAAHDAWAQQKSIKIGVLNDQSGAYADYQGIGSVIAAQLAVEDAGGKIGTAPVEVITADHKNSADLGSTIARSWYDQEGVDMIADVPNSGIALAVAQISRERNKVFIG